MGPGGAIGDALVQHPRTAGVTFTGSYETGMHIVRTLANGSIRGRASRRWAARTPASSPPNADLERAAAGIVRSAFGMGGQKCSALSRLYVQESVADELIRSCIARRSQALSVGDPTRAENWLGPVVSENAQRKLSLRTSSGCAQRGANIRFGGDALLEGELARGFYVAPTLAEAPLDASAVARGDVPADPDAARGSRDLDEGIALANDSELGLTAGIYGSPAEVERFFEQIEAGVTYANRAAGRDHRRVAGLSAVRRLEGLGQHRQGDRLVLLPRAVSCASSRRRSSNTESAMKSPHIKTAAARPEGRGDAQARRAGRVAVLSARLSVRDVARQGRGSVGRRRQSLPRLHGRHRRVRRPGTRIRRWSQAIKEAAEKFLHISSDYWHEGQIALAEKMHALNPVRRAGDELLLPERHRSRSKAALKLARYVSGPRRASSAFSAASTAARWARCRSRRANTRSRKASSRRCRA